MKLSSLLVSVLVAAGTASAYRIDLWAKYDYQGEQATFVRVFPLTSNILDSDNKAPDNRVSITWLHGEVSLSHADDLV